MYCGRGLQSKSNGVVDLKWCDKFNEWINKSSLIKLGLLGRNFTWSNNQVNVVMSHIDRIFVSTDFDSHFPIATTRALPKNISDHASLLWEDGLEEKS
jgi:hypothetical protein